MRVYISVIVMLALALGGCATTDQVMLSLPNTWAPTVLTINAEVQTVGGKSEIVIKSPSECPAFPAEMGCVEVKSGEIGIIHFVLDGGTAKSCEGQPDATWVWEEIQLTAMGNVDSSGGDVIKKVGNISQTAQGDFGATSKGDITAATINGQYMSVRDMNSAAYDIWYTLYAHQCGNATNTATSDPRVRNHGNLDAF